MKNEKPQNAKKIFINAIAFSIILGSTIFAGIYGAINTGVLNTKLKVVISPDNPFVSITNSWFYLDIYVDGKMSTQIYWSAHTGSTSSSHSDPQGAIINLRANQNHKVWAQFHGYSAATDPVTIFTPFIEEKQVTLNMYMSRYMGTLRVSGYNFGAAQTFYIYVDNEYMNTHVHADSVSKFTLPDVTVVPGVEHLVELRSSLGSSEALSSATVKIDSGKSANLTLDVQAQGQINVYGENNTTFSGYVHLYIDGLYIDDDYVSSHGSFSFAYASYEAGTKHLIEICENYGMNFSSKEVTVLPNMVLHVRLDIN